MSDQRTVTIRDARALCKTLGARGTIVIAVHGNDGLSAASYGQTKADCREMGKHLDRAYDAVVKARGPSSGSLLARACRHACEHLRSIGWPEDEGLVRELQHALAASTRLTDLPAMEIEE